MISRTSPAGVECGGFGQWTRKRRPRRTPSWWAAKLTEIRLPRPSACTARFNLLGAVGPGVDQGRHEHVPGDSTDRIEMNVHSALLGYADGGPGLSPEGTRLRPPHVFGAGSCGLPRNSWGRPPRGLRCRLWSVPLGHRNPSTPDLPLVLTGPVEPSMCAVFDCRKCAVFSCHWQLDSDSETPTLVPIGTDVPTKQQPMQPSAAEAQLQVQKR